MGWPLPKADSKRNPDGLRHPSGPHGGRRCRLRFSWRWPALPSIGSVPSWVVVAAQEDGSGIGRIRMRQVRDASAESLVPFVRDAVEPGSIVHTDGWLGYRPLDGKGYQHEVTFFRGKKKRPWEVMPRVHYVISLLKRLLMEPPGCRQPKASRLLPGRVHVPIQPATIQEPRPTVFRLASLNKPSP